MKTNISKAENTSAAALGQQTNKANAYIFPLVLIVCLFFM